MKKIFLLATVAICFSLTSCYNTKVCVGNVHPTTPVVKVQSVANHHFVYGLVAGPKTKLKASQYVSGKGNYVVKNNMTFVDGLLSAITWGIYTPTHTTFYLPLDDLRK